MATLMDYLSTNSKSIEIGIISEKKGGEVYIAIISGKSKRVYNTLDAPLSVGNRVLIGKLDYGKRYIMNNTGFNDQINTVTNFTEVFIDG